ncbi:hypothetical protein N9368_00600 [Alphaproteobacteria bacterium]|nr:hypothetical protein [Alphaproteobacteria bacterium]
MKIYKDIRISDRFLRSINIESDLSDQSALRGYISSPSSSKLLSDMCSHLRTGTQNAFTWTGPYGSGKSSLAILFQALTGADKKNRLIAQKIVGNELTEEVLCATGAKKQTKILINLVGQAEDFSTFLFQALTNRFEDIPPKNNNPVDYLKQILKSPNTKERGIILIVDEMGKFLEFSSKHGGDIYILQQIAELANRSDSRLVFIGILHQSFADYANKLSRESRDEWSKIQGRFIDHSLNLSGEEQLSLISNAINCPNQNNKNRGHANKIADAISSSRNTDAKQTCALLEKCFPLHPISASLVGHAAKRAYGQNQRSIFSFLNSAENFGFQHFLNRANYPDLYEPSAFWDYLKYNLENSIILSGDSSRWQVARDAILRAESTFKDGKLIELTKSIAIIDLFRELSGIPANISTLSTLKIFEKEAELSSALQSLERSSIVVFRKFRGSYSIFAGSDFDIDKALGEQLVKLETQNNDLKLDIEFSPILAKRHFHQTGYLRWLKIRLVFEEDLSNTLIDFKPRNDEFGLGLICLGDVKKEPSFVQTMVNWESYDFPILLTHSGSKNELLAYTKEINALKTILNTYPELRGDKVAVSEIDLRISILEQTFRGKALALIEGASWVSKTNVWEDVSSKHLSSIASSCADNFFDCAPVIKSELLNRNKPSANANAAQNQLLKNMVEENGKERLGISGYPAEAGLFFSILQPLGLYIKNENGWKFATSEELSESSSLKKLWSFTDQHIKKSSAAVPLEQIYDIWESRPFGLKKGVRAIFATAYILSRENEIVFYRDCSFQARITDLDTEVLASNPSKISLRWMKIDDFSRKILTNINKLSAGESGYSESDGSPLDVAKRLIRKFDALQPWTMRTMLLTETAKNIRTKMKVASDPNKLLFEDLFNAKKPFDEQFLAFTEAFAELSGFYLSKVNELELVLLTDLDTHTKTIESIKSLNERADKLSKLSGDFELEAFVNRLRGYSGKIEELEGILSLSVSKPTTMWTDSDYLNAKLNIRKLCMKFRDLELYSEHRGTDKGRRRFVLISESSDNSVETIEASFLDSDEQDIFQHANYVLTQIDSIENFSAEKKAAVLAAALKLVEEQPDE